MYFSNILLATMQQEQSCYQHFHLFIHFIMTLKDGGLLVQGNQTQHTSEATVSIDICGTGQ